MIKESVCIMWTLLFTFSRSVFLAPPYELSLSHFCESASHFFFYLSSDGFSNALFQEMLQPHQHPYFPRPCISQQKTCLAACQRCIFWNISVLFFRLSGFMLPSPVVSSGSILALWFTTDFAVSAQGFKAVYEGKTVCEGAYDVWMLVVIRRQCLSQWWWPAWWMNCVGKCFNSEL